MQLVGIQIYNNLYITSIYSETTVNITSSANKIKNILTYHRELLRGLEFQFLRVPTHSKTSLSVYILRSQPTIALGYNDQNLLTRSCTHIISFSIRTTTLDKKVTKNRPWRVLQEDENALQLRWASETFTSQNGVLWICTLYTLRQFQKYGVSKVNRFSGC